MTWDSEPNTESYENKLLFASREHYWIAARTLEAGKAAGAKAEAEVAARASRKKNFIIVVMMVIHTKSEPVAKGQSAG